MKRISMFQQKKIYITFVISILLSLFCIIRIAMPNQQYFYSGETVIDDGVARSDIIIYDQIALPPGVYQVEVEYRTDTVMKNLYTLADESVFTGGLLTNGENLHQALNKTSFRAWLFESTETLQVTLLYGGEGYVITGNLAIYETDSLWTMLLTIIWGVALLVIGIFAFRYYDKEFGIAKEKKQVAFFLLVITLIASIPFLQGAGVNAADYGYHLLRIEGLKDGILSGQFPVRLEPVWLYEHGYANSIFYCNALLYLPAIFRLLGFTVTSCYNLYCIVLNLATAWIAYYCFMKIFNSRNIGLVCSALYTLSVFRILKLVSTAALGEASAITFMPLVLYGLYRVFSEEPKNKSYKTAWIPIAVGYAGLIHTHVLTCEITAILTIVICAVFIKKIFVKETFIELAKGASAAIVMSLWYLVPFLDYFINEDMHIRHVAGRTIQERGLYFAQLFFNWWEHGKNATLGDEGMVNSLPMGVGLILGIGFCVFCILWFGGKWRQEKDRVVSLGKVSAVLGGVLMLMSLNVFPWDWIQSLNGVAASLVSSLQFPNRFLGWGTLFLVVICGCILWYFKKYGKKWYYYLSIVCIMAGIATSSIYLTDFVCRDELLLYIYSEDGMGFQSYISGAEYLVEGTKQELLDYAEPTASEGVDIVSYDKDYLHMWISCSNHKADAGYVELPLLHYTGYHAYVTSSGEELQTMKGTNNIVRVLLPPDFEGEIEVKFISPIHWRMSEAITALWWIIVGVMCVRCMRKKQIEKREGHNA